MGRRRRRNARLLTFLLVPGTILAVLLLAEAVLRLLPVSDSLEVQAVNAADPVLHFAPGRDLVWSRGWNFARLNRLHVNNAGFVNDRDYAADAPLPAIAVVGDSFVEASMVAPAETLHGRLAEGLAGRARVLSFAASGAPLSQYLVWAQRARDLYRPAAAVFVVVANDFDESLLKYKAAPGFHYFDAADQQATLRRIDFEVGFWRLLLRRSALARYLVLNVGVAPAGFRGGAGSVEFVGNVAARWADGHLADGHAAGDLFLARVGAATGLAPEKIVLVVDGLRPALYTAEGLAAARGSAFARLRDAFIAAARDHGFAVVDMQPLFVDAFARDGRRFEFADDGHWNGHAHGLAAAAVKAALPAEAPAALLGHSGSPDAPSPQP